MTTDVAEIVARNSYEHLTADEVRALIAWHRDMAFQAGVLRGASDQMSAIVDNPLLARTAARAHDAFQEQAERLKALNPGGGTDGEEG